jgi:hypothetical protein
MTEGTSQAPVEQAVDRRYKKVKHPETQLEVNRVDYIRELWTQKKWKRGAIAKHISELTGEKVPYQIVFAATKKLAGGPDPEPAATAGGEASGESAGE